MAECVTLRDAISDLVGVPLTEPQLLLSAHIMEGVLADANFEIPLLWCRRFGKTELLAQTAITLGVYFIHRLQRQFLVGLANPARNEQSIMVTRTRLQERLNTCETWFTKSLGITKILGDGRKTPDYILHDPSGAECQIRAISADPSAHERGAGFHLLLLEQCEEMDESTMKTSIFPMAAGRELTCTQVLAGTPSLEVRNAYYRDRTRDLQYPYLVDYRTASQYRPSYARWVEAERERLGEDSDEFRTQYGCEWIQLRNKLIDREELLLLAKDYVTDPRCTRYAGTDLAKMVDRTVCTIVERSGPDLIILDWLDLEGTDYEEQADLITGFLKQHHVTLNLVDATGAGDPVVDMLTSRCRGICETRGFKFTAESADRVYKVYEREIKQHRLRFVKARDQEPEILRRSRNRFIEEHQDVERVYSTNKLKLQAPKRGGSHDDYVASAALAVYAAVDATTHGFDPAAMGSWWINENRGWRR